MNNILSVIHEYRQMVGTRQFVFELAAFPFIFISGYAILAGLAAMAG